jgi:hypothetical protein
LFMIGNFCFCCWNWMINDFWLSICIAFMGFLFDLIWLLDIQRAYRAGPMHPQPRVCLTCS